MAFSNDYNEYDDEFYDEEFEKIDKEERMLRQQGRFRVAAGVMDFLGVIGGMVVVLLLVALLVSLVNWLYEDIFRTITILQTRI